MELKRCFIYTPLNTAQGFDIKLHVSTKSASSDHVDFPQKLEGGPEVAVEEAEGEHVVPDGADGACEGHVYAHLVARCARGEESGDLGSDDVGKGAAECGSARTCAGEHGGWHREEHTHES